ncbi:MAG: single-stranded DNA-binding protein [Nannocystaceae bacterium]
MSLNRATIWGRLGRDPQLRETKGGVPVCNLHVGTTRKIQDRQTHRTVTETEWHRVTVWGKHAEHCYRHLQRGSQIYAEGRLRTNTYEDRDGVTRSSTEIVADKVEFIRAGDTQTSDAGSSDPAFYEAPGLDD